MSAPQDPPRVSLRELFDRAIELAPDARERFVDDLASAGDTRAARLREMLRDEDAHSPLDADPWQGVGVLAGEGAGEGCGAAEVEEPPPSRLGPYRVLSELGRGGMGRVYLAEQEGDGFRRTVALKVLAGETGAGDERERRFAAERAILAGLEHPGIARFYDAGRAADGRWYLALEHVAGANLLEHARAQQLAVADRIRLFLAVLDAVTYAHGRGIVHRDLKPANVLVGADGRPRLLDFGIAKLLDGPQSGSAPRGATAAATIAGARALTPAYASPEQFRGEPITVASDVFSLGVVLYELLAGVHPFAVPTGSAYDLEQAVLTRDPLPPSVARRRTSAAAPAPGTSAPPDAPQTPIAARLPATEPTLPARGRRLSHDLDAICLQALRKAPAERYPSAAELARDLERHLAGEPVAARGADRRYRVARFVRRRGAAFAVAFGLAVAFLAGAFWLPRGAAPGRSPAEPPPRTFPFSNVDASAAADLEARFAAEPASLETGAHLAMALAKGGRVAEARLVLPRLRQIPGRAEDPLIDYVEGSLDVGADEPQAALVHFGTALERALAGGRGELVSQIRAARGRLLSTLGRGAEARADMTAALAGFEASGDLPSQARVLNDLAVEELQRGRLAAGERQLERALAASRAANPGGSGGGVILGNLAGIAMLRGHPDSAALRCRESIQIYRNNGSHRLAWALSDCSEIFRDLGRSDEADAALSEALSLLAARPSGSDLAIALGYRGDAELAAGERARAAATAAAIERAASTGGDRPAQAHADRLRAGLAAQQGDLATARRLFAEARTLEAGSGQEDAAASTDLEAARLELDFGELDAATALVDRAAGSAAGNVREGSTAFFAAILRAEIDLAMGRVAESGVRLQALGEPESLPSLRRRLGLLAARARHALAEGRREAARRDLERARGEAEACGLRVRALELRLELARLDESASPGLGDADRALPAARSRERQQIVDEANRLGLTRLAHRAAGA